MDKEFLALLAILIAGAVTVAGTPGPFSPWETIIGIILCFLLPCIKPTEFHIPEKLALGAIAGLCLTITFGWPIEMLFDKYHYFPIPCGEEESKERHFFFFGLWLLLSIAVFFIFIF